MHLDGPSSQSNTLMKVMRGYKERKDLKKIAGRAMPRQKFTMFSRRRVINL